jgi:hypothetical protein
MDQAEPFRKLEQAFRQHITDENEKLIARYNSTGQAWHFEGSHLSERTFKTLAREGGLHLADDPSQDAWRQWLDELRRNQSAPVGSAWWEESNQGAVDLDDQSSGAEMKSSEPLPMVLDRLFSTSALVCLEWATEISSRMRLFEKMSEPTSEQPGDSGEETDAPGTEEEIAIRSAEGWNWAPLLFESSDDAEQRLKEHVKEALNLIEEALDLGLRKDAVRFWLSARQSKNLKATKVALYDEAEQDKAEYYRWKRGELPDGSQADRDIRRVLRSIVE